MACGDRREAPAPTAYPWFGDAGSGPDGRSWLAGGSRRERLWTPGTAGYGVPDLWKSPYGISRVSAKVWQMAQKTPRRPASVLRKREATVAKASPVPASDVGLNSGSSAPCSRPEG